MNMKCSFYLSQLAPLACEGVTHNNGANTHNDVVDTLVETSILLRLTKSQAQR
jgi:hypothetical protein